MVEEGYEPAVQYATEDEARAAAETLVLRGIGASWEEADEPPAEGMPAGYFVVVADGEATRAREVLGVPEPEPSAEALAARAKRGRPQWLYVGGIFLVAMIVIPVIAFYVSFKLAGG